MLHSHHCSLFTDLCAIVIVGISCTSQCLQELIKQQIPKPVLNHPSPSKPLSPSCKANRSYQHRLNSLSLASIYWTTRIALFVKATTDSLFLLEVVRSIYFHVSDLEAISPYSLGSKRFFLWPVDSFR